jgi:hypothetical protein
LAAFLKSYNGGEHFIVVDYIEDENLALLFVVFVDLSALFLVN